MLRYGTEATSFILTFPHWCCGSFFRNPATMCSPGGSGTWRFDGSPPESHGEVLSSCLVWESRDERSPPSDQKVGFPLLSPSTSFHACLCTSFSPVFSLCGCSGIKRCWHFPGRKSSRVSVSPLIQTRTDMFWKVATEQWLIQFGFQCLIISHLHSRHSFQMFDVLSQVWKNASKVQCVDIYADRKWFPLPLCDASRLKDHVNDKTKLPILIFPEGKCDRAETQSYFFHAVSCLSLYHQHETEWVVVFSCAPSGSLTPELWQMSSYFMSLDGAHTTLSPLISWCLVSTGTCINNTSVMMFKKGSFEIGATIYPVAMKVPQSCLPVELHLSFSCFSVLHVLIAPLCIFELVSVRPKIWRRFLEQLQVQHGQLPAEDDDQLGPRL